MDLKTFVMNIFMVIGMIVCVVVTTIALIYAVCYAVKLLFKTFGAKISSSYDIMMEDIREKNLAKKQRKKEKRIFDAEQKREMQNLKLLSEAEVFEMKKKRYRDKLRDKENKAWIKLFNESVPREVIIPDLEERSGAICSSSILDITKIDTSSKPIDEDDLESDDNIVNEKKESENLTEVLQGDDLVSTNDLETKEITPYESVEKELVEDTEINGTTKDTDNKLIDEIDGELDKDSNDEKIESEIKESETLNEGDKDTKTKDGLKLNEINDIENLSDTKDLEEKKNKKRKRKK